MYFFRFGKFSLFINLHRWDIFVSIPMEKMRYRIGSYVGTAPVTKIQSPEVIEYNTSQNANFQILEEI